MGDQPTKGEQPDEKDRYPWYAVVEGNTIPLQGDFINKCPIVVPVVAEQIKEDQRRLQADIKLINVVVLSQSCDLEQKKISLVLVCPVVLFSKFEEEQEFFRGSKGKKALKEGYAPGYHLMNKCDEEGFERGLVVADFRNVYGVPLDYLLGFCKESGRRLRLLPPYREHLSQAFARYFMRVGLPVGVDLN